MGVSQVQQRDREVPSERLVGSRRAACLPRVVDRLPRIAHGGRPVPEIRLQIGSGFHSRLRPRVARRHSGGTADSALGQRRASSRTTAVPGRGPWPAHGPAPCWRRIARDPAEPGCWSGRPWPGPRSALRPFWYDCNALSVAPSCRCTSPRLLYETERSRLAWALLGSAGQGLAELQALLVVSQRLVGGTELQVHVAELVVRDGEVALAWASLGSALASASLSFRASW